LFSAGLPPIAVVFLEPGGDRAWAWVANWSIRRSSNSTVECQDSMTALSNAGPGRPIIWVMPQRWQAARNVRGFPPGGPSQKTLQPMVGRTNRRASRR
jgi:hypothetical protein